MKTLNYFLLAYGLASALVAAKDSTPEKAKEPDVIRYSFDGDEVDKQAWRIYDYAGDNSAETVERAKKAGGRNVFYPVSWEKSGGFHGSGYIWADDSRWRIDTPENPHSILALLIYQRWKTPRGVGQGTLDGKGGPVLDLRNAEVSLYLRGDNLDLKGAKLYFWVVSGFTRWHFDGQPLAVSDRQWGDRITFVLKNDASLWHRSWLDARESPPPALDHVLGNVISYGFAFVGFSGEVTGRLAMDDLVIKLAGK